MNKPKQAKTTKTKKNPTKNKKNPPLSHPVTLNNQDGSPAYKIPTNQLYRWFFTLPMEKMEASHLSQFLREWCKKFTFQGEEGIDGYKHWQGHFSLINKEYFGTIKNIMPREMHLEGTRDYLKAEKYVTKNYTRICGPYNQDTAFVEDPLEGLTYYPYQLEIIKELQKKPDPRKICNYWEPIGKVGKSDFVKHLLMNNPDYVLVEGRGVDIKYTVYHHWLQRPNIKAVFIDIPRVNEDHVSYAAIEQIKNGLMVSTKFKCGRCIFNKPHVFIFSNSPMDITKMSADRWYIHEIKLNHPKCEEFNQEDEVEVEF